MSAIHHLEKNQFNTRILIDRKERLVAELLSRFKNLATLACSPSEKGASKEVAAAQAFQMEVESTALVRATEDLHRLVRELKEMWLFGTQKETNENVNEGTIDDDSVRVGELLNDLIDKLKNSHFNNFLAANQK